MIQCINFERLRLSPSRLACAIPAPICPAPTTPMMRGRSFEAAVVIYKAVDTRQNEMSS